MRYEIKGTPFPMVICQLENGEQMVTERGSMVWMSLIWRCRPMAVDWADVL